MGMYGGGKKNDPWDTQEEKNAWLTGTGRTQAKQSLSGGISDWNREAGQYNTMLGNISGQASSAKDKLADLDYTANLSNLQGYGSNAQSRLDSLSGLTRPSGARPQRKKIVDTPWGTKHQFDFTSDFDLTDPRSDYGAISRMVSGNLGRATSLGETHETKKSAWQKFRDQQNTDFSNLQKAYGKYDISDALKGGGVYSSLGDLGTEESQTAQFGNNLFMPSDWQGKKKTAYAGLDKKLDQLIADRVTEEGRIKTWGSDLTGRLEGYEKSLGGYDIRNLSELEAMEDSLKKEERDAAAFSSLLPFDFSTQKQFGTDIGADVTSLLQDREDELDRISDAQSDYYNEAMQAKRGGRYLDTRSLAGIEELEDEYGDISGDISGFSSLLPTDFSRALGVLGDVDTRTKALRTDRKSELDALIAKAGTYSDKISGTPIYEEDLLDRLLSEIENKRRGAAEYTGGRAGEATGAFDTQSEAVQGRLGDLLSKRRSLESRAKSMLNQSRLGYYNTGSLDASADALERLRGDIDMYGAEGAYDELDLILAQLEKERGRLGSERDARSAAQKASDRRVLPRSFGLKGPMTEAEYAALIAKKRDDELPTSGSAFGSLV